MYQLLTSSFHIVITNVVSPLGQTSFCQLPVHDTWYTGTRLLEPDQISHTQRMVAKRSLTNRANVDTPYVKKSFKTQHAEFQAIKQFWLQLDIVS